MKKYVHQFLSAEYYIKDNRLYNTSESRIGKTSLCQKLGQIFQIPEKEAKWFIKSWWRKNGGGDFNEYWKSTLSVKLKVTWTPEMAQDLMGYHNIDAEAELYSQMAINLSAEIDREIIREMISMAGG